MCSFMSNRAVCTAFFYKIIEIIIPLKVFCGFFLKKYRMLPVIFFLCCGYSFSGERLLFNR